MKKSVPSIFKIILGDYISFFCIFILLLVFGISLYFIFTEEISSDQLNNLLLIVTTVLLVLVFLLLLRIRLIRYVFSCGKLVQGKIKRIRRNSRRGFTVNSRITFSYKFKGRNYNKNCRLLSDEKLRDNQTINIIVDPEKSRRAFIYSVFTDG